MQSGVARSRDWVLEYTSSARQDIDPLMGWTGCSDTGCQVRITFDSREAAIAYARARDLEYVVIEAQNRKPKIRNRGYGENFAYERRETWTH